MARPATVDVSADVLIAASVTAVWDAVTDWPAQSRWMLGTRVRVTSGTGRRVGDALEAVTGFGRLGVRDPMVLTTWQPPQRCVVRHTGRVVRGDGILEVLPVGADHSRLVWTERLLLPNSAAANAAWPLTRPVLLAGVRHSLRRFARLVQQDVGDGHAA